jgi:hypothetical protein
MLTPLQQGVLIRSQDLLTAGHFLGEAADILSRHSVLQGRLAEASKARVQ